MKEFEPSPDFTKKVMKAVYEFEASKERRPAPLWGPLPMRLMSYGLPIGGAIFGLLNILRLCFTFIAPAVCH
ncbi:MAG: hypothetical protein M0033_13730 [Nitrospiraceae bacterium]|nr:hypothetical protein [Nitrospiraceae bacterium]